MKRTINILTIIFFIAFICSCEEDPCEGKNCENGVCEPIVGKCICIDGFQTDSSGICTIEWTSKFIGSYNANDTCVGANPGNYNYNSNITAISNKDIIINPLGGVPYAVTGRANSSISFSIDTIFSDGKVLTGSGTQYDTSIVINYILNDTINNLSDTCLTTFY